MLRGPTSFPRNLHRVLGVPYRVLGVLHRVAGVLHRVLKREIVAFVELSLYAKGPDIVF